MIPTFISSKIFKDRTAVRHLQKQVQIYSLFAENSRNRFQVSPETAAEELNVQIKFHRAMVGTVYSVVDFRPGNPVLQRIRHEEIIYAPTGIARAGIEPV